MPNARFCLALLVSALLTVSLAAAAEADKVRIYVTESGAVQASGEAQVGEAKGFLAVDGGVSRMNTEVMRLFLEECADTVVVTADREAADYLVRIDSEGMNPTTPFVKSNKVAVFDRNQDLVYSDRHRLRKNAVKRTCAMFEARR